MFKRRVVIVLIGLLGGCSGTGPVFYTDPVDGALAQITAVNGGSFLSILKQDREGCIYESRLGHRYHASKSRSTALVRANQPVLMNYDYNMGRYRCEIPFAFYAQAGEKYQIVSGSGSEKDESANGLRRLLGTDNRSICTIRILRETGDGTEVVPVVKLQIAVEARATEAVEQGNPGSCRKTSTTLPGWPN